MAMREKLESMRQDREKEQSNFPFRPQVSANLPRSKPIQERLAEIMKKKQDMLYELSSKELQQSEL